MASLDVSDCQALQQVICTENDALSSAGLAGCVVALHFLALDDDRALTSLDLTRCEALRQLLKQGCERLGDVDVSACLLLRENL